MIPKEIFFSHAHEDMDRALAIIQVLRQLELNVWFAPQAIVGAAQWHDEIGRALARCDWFLLLLTPRAVASRWVKRELIYALTHDRYDGRLTPSLYETCDIEQLSWILPSLQIIDFRMEPQAALIELLRPWSLKPRAG